MFFLKKTCGETIIRKCFYEKFFSFGPSFIETLIKYCRKKSEKNKTSFHCKFLIVFADNIGLIDY